MKVSYVIPTSSNYSGGDPIRGEYHHSMPEDEKGIRWEPLTNVVPRDTVHASWDGEERATKVLSHLDAYFNKLGCHCHPHETITRRKFAPTTVEPRSMDNEEERRMVEKILSFFHTLDVGKGGSL